MLCKYDNTGACKGEGEPTEYDCLTCMVAGIRNHAATIITISKKSMMKPDDGYIFGQNVNMLALKLDNIEKFITTKYPEESKKGVEEAAKKS